MITLDQIKQLDIKVHKAVDKINSLKNENSMLQEKLATYQLRIEELEILIDTFKEDQGEIEHGIIDAINQLDLLEENPIITDTNLQEEEKDLEEEVSSETEKESENSEHELEETDTESSTDEETQKLSEESSDSEIELDIF